MRVSKTESALNSQNLENNGKISKYDLNKNSISHFVPQQTNFQNLSNEKYDPSVKFGKHPSRKTFKPRNSEKDDNITVKNFKRYHFKPESKNNNKENFIIPKHLEKKEKSPEFSFPEGGWV